jgi:hypothetical protein
MISPELNFSFLPFKEETIKRMPLSFPLICQQREEREGDPTMSWGACGVK